MTRRADRSTAMLTDQEAEALRLNLLEMLPKLERRHLFEIADMLHDAARERRRPEQKSFDAWS